MNRRAFLHTGVAVTGIAVAGCSNDAPTGTLATYVGDPPDTIDDFSSCVVTIDELRVLPADDTTGTEEHAGDELVFKLDECEIDLTELRGEPPALAREHELATGEYAYLKLVISSVAATLDGGDAAMVTTSDDAALQFNHSFRIRTDQRTRFTADFAPVPGNDRGRYRLQSIPSETAVSYE